MTEANHGKAVTVFTWMIRPWSRIAIGYQALPT